MPRVSSPFAFSFSVEFYLGVRYAEGALELVGLAKHDVFFTRLQLFFHPLYALEPDQLDRAAIVSKFSHQPFFSLCTGHTYARYLSAQLHVRQIGTYLLYLIEPGPVNIAERVEGKQVEEGEDPQLFFKGFSALGSYAFEVFDGGLQEGIHQRLN